MITFKYNILFLDDKNEEDRIINAVVVKFLYLNSICTGVLWEYDYSYSIFVRGSSNENTVKNI